MSEGSLHGGKAVEHSDASTTRELADVFVSYNSDDGELASLLVDALVAAGTRAWFDRERLSAGGRWQEELAAGLAASRSCAVLVGPAGVGDWSRMELMAALDRAAKDPDFRVFPVLMPGAPEPVDVSSLPPFLSSSSWVDLRGGWSTPEALDVLVAAVHGLSRVTPLLEVQDDAVAPYVGLRHFDVDDAVWFFGREAELQRVVERLRSRSFLAVVGPSGAGKSSLVKAGLVPALRSGALEDGRGCRIVSVTPGARPLESLATGWWVAMGATGKLEDVLDAFESDPRALHLRSLAAVAPTAERVVVVVDQFEELWTLCQDEAQRRRFIELLLHATAPDTDSTLVVLTMRSDFYSHLAREPELARVVESQQFLVQRLDAKQLRRIVEAPAAAAGLEVERGLVRTILRDVADQPGVLPLVQHALYGVWQLRRGRQLTVEAYQAVGGVDGALAATADGVLANLDPTRREAARRLFFRLTRFGEGTDDTRRRVDGVELAQDPDPEAIDEVISAFVQARLLTTDAAPRLDGGADRYVEVAHEALIRSWPTLRAWLDEDREALTLHRRITAAAAEWDGSGRGRDLLWRGAPLMRADALLASDPGLFDGREEAFVRASTDERDLEVERWRRRQRRTVSALVAGVAVVSALGLWANQQRGEAERQAVLASSSAELADRNEALSRARALAAEARDAMTADSDLAVHLAIEAVELSRAVGDRPDPKATSVLLEAVVSHRYTSTLPAPMFAVQPLGDGRVVAWPAEQESGPWLQMLDAATGNVANQFEMDGFSIADLMVVENSEYWWSAPYTEVAMRSGGDRVVGALEDALVVWSADDGTMLHRLEVPADLLSDGGRLVEPNIDATGRWAYGEFRRGQYDIPIGPWVPLVWDLSTPDAAPVRLPNELEGPTGDAAISPTGHVALRAMRAGVAENSSLDEFWDGERVVVMDIRSVAQVYEVDVQHLGERRGLVFSRDGLLVIGERVSGQVTVHDVVAGQQVGELYNGLLGTGGSELLCLVDDDRVLATLSREQGIRRWSFPDLTFLDEVPLPSSPTPTTASFERFPVGLWCDAGSGQAVVRLQDEGTVHVLDLSAGPGGDGVPVPGVYDVGDGAPGTYVVLDGAGSLHTVSKDDGRVLHSRDGLHPLNKQIVVDRAGTVVWGQLAEPNSHLHVLLDLPGLTERRELPLGGLYGFAHAMSPDGRWLGIDRWRVTENKRHQMVYDIETGERVVLPQLYDAELNGTAFSGDAYLMVPRAGLEQDGGKILDLRDGSVREWESPMGASEVSASDDGRVVLVAGLAGGVEGAVFRDVDWLREEAPKPVAHVTLDGARSKLSPDGRFILSPNGQGNGRDRVVVRRIDGSVVWEYDERVGAASFANFSRDSGRVLAAVGGGAPGGQGVIELPTDVDELLAMARERVTRELRPAECATYLWAERCVALGIASGEEG